MTDAVRVAIKQALGNHVRIRPGFANRVDREKHEIKESMHRLHYAEEELANVDRAIAELQEALA